jgi:hypothetical protein
VAAFERNRRPDDSGLTGRNRSKSTAEIIGIASCRRDNIDPHTPLVQMDEVPGVEIALRISIRAVDNDDGDSDALAGHNQPTPSNRR